MATVRLLVCTLLLLLLTGCADQRDLPPASHREVILAVAVPLEDSGLLRSILPEFARLHSLTPLRALAVPSREAVRMAQEGEADVIITHLPAEEEKLVREGHVVSRHELMSDDYLLVGPPSDPAGAKSAADAVEAFRRVGKGMHPFITRGDGSGTQVSELELWDRTDVVLASNWYLSAKRGAAETLALASERASYTLVDRATYLARGKGLPLTPMSEGDPLLRNQYSVQLISAKKHPGANQRAGQVFVEWITSAETAKLISVFGLKEFGRSPYTSTDR